MSDGMRTGRGRRWTIGALLAVAILAGLAWAAGTLFPKPVSALMLAGLRASAGLEVKSVEMDFGPVRYLEGGEGPAVVLLHGIYARKEHWIDMTRALTDGYRVIAPDLPGFGGNPVLGAGAYDYEDQADRLAAWLERVTDGPFHLAGNSMGGQLAAMLAERMPGRVRSLALIGSPVGVTSPEASDMEQAIRRGDTPPLVVTSPEAFHARMAWLFPETPFMPAPVVETWAAEEAALAEDNRRIWREVAGSAAPRLEDLAPGIDIPSLIIWCREDRIFHITGARVLADRLPGARLHELSGCGHVPMLDRPADTGRLYRAFLDGPAA